MGSDCRRAQLSDVAAINPRRKVKKGDVVPFIEMAALPLSGRDVASSDIQARAAKSSGAHFRDGDTLFARITPCLENGKTAQVRSLGKGVVGEGSTEFIVLCGHEEDDNDFVYYLSRSQEFREFAIARMEGTSGRQRVAWQSLAGYQLSLPPPEVRRDAADFLAKLDDRIGLLRQTNDTLEAIAQALFKSWFVDFDPVRARAEGREPEGMDAATAVLLPSEFEDSELGSIPKGWSVDEIGNVISCVGGATPSTKDDAYWVGGAHHWATPKDLSGLQAPILTTTERRITDAGVARIGSGVLPTGTLLMSSRAPIGYLAISAVPTAINQGFIAIPPGGRLPPSYLLFWARTNMELIKQKANGSTFMEISKGAFRPIKVCVPSPAVINAFAKVAEPLLKRIELNELHRVSLAETREAILPRLISGRLRLPEAEAAVDALAVA